tara:strand:- start:628 stop:846 length:219 start_codon:yes stop_codon:yes gene_type:complete
MMMWTAVVEKKNAKHEVVQFNGPWGFTETYARLHECGYNPVALIKGSHPVTTDGNEPPTPKNITSLITRGHV